MNATSATVPPDVDEFELAGIEKEACRLVPVPRVKASPVVLECRHHLTVPLPGANGVANDFLVIGQVVGVHIADDLIVDGRVNTAALTAVARLGYSEYATISDTWQMRRPGTP
jgi:flavin reductase (DIM6/NTAB) family NADH-FMN oxidoreductase RutF